MGRSLGVTLCRLYVGCPNIAVIEWGLRIQADYVDIEIPQSSRLPLRPRTTS